MKNVLLATPHMPPTPGGPSTHAKKLTEHFGLPIFNFEKYLKFPSGIRHLFAFAEIFFRSLNKKIILALDGFTVALPSVVVGKILRKKVILRVGGDFIYEQFLTIKEIDLESFYKNFSDNKKLFSNSLYIKYLFHRLILQNAGEIIFNTEWQKEIFKEHYKLKQRLFTIENPIEPLAKEKYEQAKLEDDFENAIRENKYIFTSITRDIPYKNLKRLKKVFENIGDKYYLETKQGSFESCLKRITHSRAYICASISDISPNQVQEAISLKIPVIITKYSGITAVLEKAGVARVVDPFDEQDIKNAILEICEEQKYLEYKRNLETFTWPQTWETLFKQYQEILK